MQGKQMNKVLEMHSDAARSKSLSLSFLGLFIDYRGDFAVPVVVGHLPQMIYSCFTCFPSGPADLLHFLVYFHDAQRENSLLKHF